MRKVFDKNFSSHKKQHNTRRVQFLFFGSVLLVLAKFSFSEED